MVRWSVPALFLHTPGKTPSLRRNALRATGHSLTPGCPGRSREGEKNPDPGRIEQGRGGRAWARPSQNGIKDHSGYCIGGKRHRRRTRPLEAAPMSFVRAGRRTELQKSPSMPTPRRCSLGGRCRALACGTQIFRQPHQHGAICLT